MSGRILALAKELGTQRVKSYGRRSTIATRRNAYGRMFTTLPEVHLVNRPGTSVTRASGSKARRLNEAGQPAFRTGAAAVADPAYITNIINWLDVEHSARYQPGSGNTYCNIYAYDFFGFAGGYVPRVWWRPSVTSPTPAQIANPTYDTDVGELNANALYDWFISNGSDFGWVESTPAGNYTTLQNQANAGHLVLIVYKNSHGHGHICAIVPEVTGHSAVRTGTTVTIPLQSQAGASNYKYHTRAWWGSNTTVKYWVKTLPAAAGGGGGTAPAPSGSAAPATSGPSAGTIGQVAGGILGGVAAGPIGAIVGSEVGQRVGNWIGSQSYSNGYGYDDGYSFGKNFNYQDDYATGYGYANNYYAQQFTVQDDFIARYSQMAIDSCRATQVPASVTLAQAALESGWGRHAPGNNFFGIKAGRSWTGQRQLLRTREVHADGDRNRHPYPEIISITPRSDGRFDWVVRDHFRAYPSALESFNDHGNLLRNSARYRTAFQFSNNGIRFAEEIARAGYATAPNYAASLTSLINQYNLTRFDAPNP
jgi:hypothetical protein